MKYCPICDERYDEDIIRFCTKDGTPLVDEAQPNFTALPSESGEETADLGEETIVRRKVPQAASSADDQDLSGRIIIPTATPDPQPVRPRTATTYYPPPPPQNTAKTVILTIFGTLAVVGFGAALFWFLSDRSEGNLNVNTNVNMLTNQNVNLNTNLGFDANFNFNTNANFSIGDSINTNLNTNMRSPSPTPTQRTSPSPSPEPSPSPDRSPTPERSPTPRPSPTVSTSPRPAVSPTVRFTPRPTTSNSNTR